MDLSFEALDDIDSPLSNDFWAGFGIGLGMVALGAGIAALT
jgi:hypothetical protein